MNNLEEEKNDLILFCQKIIHKPDLLTLVPEFVDFMEEYIDRRKREGDGADLEESLPPEFEESDSPKTHGKKAMKDKKYEEAIRHFSECTHLESPLVYSMRAEAYYCNDDVEAALRDVEKALALNQNCAKALVVKSRCFQKNNNLEEAFLCASRAQSNDYNPDVEEYLQKLKKDLDRVRESNELPVRTGEPAIASSTPSASGTPSVPSMDMFMNPEMIAMAQQMMRNNPELMANAINSVSQDKKMQQAISDMASMLQKS